jgi:hypothetical protein
MELFEAATYKIRKYYILSPVILTQSILCNETWRFMTCKTVANE